MKLSEIQSLIRKFIFDRYPTASNGDLTDSDSLLDSGIIDSLGVMDLVSYIEQEFELTLSEDDLEADDFASIESIAAFVHRRTQFTSPEA